MLEQLKEASKLLLIPTIALYLCGFLCVTGYLARFGIVTFDIANARFLIAGVHSVVALAVCLATGWALHSQLFKNEDFWRLKHWPTRLGFYISFISLPLFLAGIFRSIYSVGQSESVGTETSASFNFSPWFGRLDILGKVLQRWHFVSSTELGWIFGYTVYVSAYLIIVGAILAAISFLAIRGIRILRGDNRPTTAVNTSENEPASAVIIPDGKFDLIRVIAAAVVDVVGVTLIIAVVSYSWKKTAAEAFGVGSLTSTNAIDFQILFAWVFTTVFASFIFLAGQGMAPEQIGSNIKRSFFVPANAGNLLQVLVIPLLIALYTFGATIYPRIPFQVGGGEPMEVGIVSHQLDTHTQAGRYFELGESDQFVFVVRVSVDGAKTFQINKASIEFLESKPSVR